MIEPDYMHLFESTKGKGRKKTNRNMRKKHQLLQTSTTFPSGSSTSSQFDCKSFWKGSLTAVGPAGYNGGGSA